jgi:putative membrane protein
MIERYSDHAANERTFLAWVRTAIAIMAFGFLVEKFDLFVSLASRQMADKQVAAHTLSIGGQTLGNIAGLVLILLGGATLLLAIVRFRKTAADIDSGERRQGPGERLDITLGGLLVLLGAAMAVYLVYTTVSKF